MLTLLTLVLKDFFAEHGQEKLGERGVQEHAEIGGVTTVLGIELNIDSGAGTCSVFDLVQDLVQGAAAQSPSDSKPTRHTESGTGSPLGSASRVEDTRSST
jgi:hypothetical protein